MKTAMRQGDALTRDTLRMALSSAHNAEVAARRPLTDDELVGVLTKETKSRRESIEAYHKVGREDLADKERAEADILAAYLPQQLTDEEVRALVAQAHRRDGCELCPRPWSGDGLAVAAHQGSRRRPCRVRARGPGAGPPGPRGT